MSGQTLIIECGVAETRAALIGDDRTLRFWFGPARGDERKDNAPRPGRRFAGRVRAVNKALAAAFVDIGDGRESYLPVKKPYAEEITEGALIATSIKAPPRQDKGALLRYSSGDGRLSKPGRLEPIEDAAVEAAKQIGGEAEAVIVDDGRAAAALKAAALDALVEHEERPLSLFEKYGADAELEAAFERAAPISGGGRLVIDETEALTAMDVDTGRLTAPSPTRLREKIAIAAAREAARQVGLRNIGGHVVIDFPSLDTKASRDRFCEALRGAMDTIKGAGAMSFSKSGLFSFTAPHSAQSLLERFTEPEPSAPVSGRRFTLDWQAKAALRRLEKRLRAAPTARVHLRVGAKLCAYFNRRPVWADRLGARYGARFDIVMIDALEARGYDVSE